MCEGIRHAVATDILADTLSLTWRCSACERAGEINQSGIRAGFFSAAKAVHAAELQGRLIPPF